VTWNPTIPVTAVFGFINITEITQNATMITPGKVKIISKSGAGILQSFRFIPTGGYWKYWQLEIVEEQNNWRSKD
jgi:hypothetical protein